MASVLVEALCPKHGLERFKIKIIKRFNIASDEILPKFRTKPKNGELNLLYIGRNVNYSQAKEYLVNYFREKGIIEEILRIRMTI